MFNPLKTLEKINNFRKGEFFGDLAALKLDLFAKKDHESSFYNSTLEMKVLTFRPLSLIDLEKMPKGSLGCMYAKFLKHNNLKPLNFSSLSEELFNDYPVSMRYIRVHDFFHCLLDFKTDIPGEVGVYSFVGEQNYNQTLRRAAHFAQLSTVVFLHKREELKKARKRGRLLSKGAVPLILAEFENRLEEPVDQLRREWIPNFCLS